MIWDPQTDADRESQGYGRLTSLSPDDEAAACAGSGFLLIVIACLIGMAFLALF